MTSFITVIYFGNKSISILLEFSSQAFYSCSEAEIALKSLEKGSRFLEDLALLGVLDIAGNVISVKAL